MISRMVEPGSLRNRAGASPFPRPERGKRADGAAGGRDIGGDGRVRAEWRNSCQVKQLGKIIEDYSLQEEESGV